MLNLGDRSKGLTRWVEGLFRSLFSKPLIGGLILLTIFAVPVGVTVYYGFKDSNKQAVVIESNICTSDNDLMSKVASSRNSANRDELKVITETIKQKPDYDKDQNCLYGFIQYYLLIGDSVNARSYYDKYSAVYTVNKDIFMSSELSAPYKEDLSKKVEYLEEENRQAIENARRRGQYVPE